MPRYILKAITIVLSRVYAFTCAKHRMHEHSLSKTTTGTEKSQIKKCTFSEWENCAPWLGRRNYLQFRTLLSRSLSSFFFFFFGRCCHAFHVALLHSRQMANFPLNFRLTVRESASSVLFLFFFAGTASSERKKFSFFPWPVSDGFYVRKRTLFKCGNANPIRWWAAIEFK